MVAAVTEASIGEERERMHTMEDVSPDSVRGRRAKMFLASGSISASGSTATGSGYVAVQGSN